MTFPHNMIPQSYPLGCKTVSFGYYLVIGWTTDGLPVVVKSGAIGGSATEVGPFVLSDQVEEYYAVETGGQ